MTRSEILTEVVGLKDALNTAKWILNEEDIKDIARIILRATERNEIDKSKLNKDCRRCKYCYEGQGINMYDEIVGTKLKCNLGRRCFYHDKWESKYKEEERW